MDEQKLDVTAQQPDAALHAQTEEITNEALPEALLEQQAAQAELSQAIEASAEELQPEQAEQTTQPERVTVWISASATTPRPTSLTPASCARYPAIM